MVHQGPTLPRNAQSCSNCGLETRFKIGQEMGCLMCLDRFSVHEMFLQEFILDA